MYLLGFSPAVERNYKSRLAALAVIALVLVFKLQKQSVCAGGAMPCFENSGWGLARAARRPLVEGMRYSSLFFFSSRVWARPTVWFWLGATWLGDGPNEASLYNICASSINTGTFRRCVQWCPPTAGRGHSMAQHPTQEAVSTDHKLSEGVSQACDPNWMGL